MVSFIYITKIAKLKLPQNIIYFLHKILAYQYLDLCIQYIEDIYFFEVNTKYISSSAVKKISIFHECVARGKMLIFSPHKMKYVLYLP